MDLQNRKAALIEACLFLEEQGMNLATEGNVSMRCGDFFLLTPSAVPAASLRIDDLVVLGMDGKVREGSRKPSSEWRIHRDLLGARPEMHAVVHTHPVYATALSCTRRGIPSFHYMVAVAGGPDIRCSGYARFGSAELSREVLRAMRGRKACLLANHGLVCAETDLQRALALSLQVERLARQYAVALQMGEPVLLGKMEMEQVLAAFTSYQASDIP